jgi:hypothetical protein
MLSGHFVRRSDRSAAEHALSAFSAGIRVPALSPWTVARTKKYRGRLGRHGRQFQVFTQTIRIRSAGCSIPHPLAKTRPRRFATFSGLEHCLSKCLAGGLGREFQCSR